MFMCAAMTARDPNTQPSGRRGGGGGGNNNYGVHGRLKRLLPSSHTTLSQSRLRFPLRASLVYSESLVWQVARRVPRREVLSYAGGASVLRGSHERAPLRCPQNLPRSRLHERQRKGRCHLGL